MRITQAFAKFTAVNFRKCYANFIISENNVKIPLNLIPKKISRKYLYNKSTKKEKELINNFYIFGKYDSMYFDKNIKIEEVEENEIQKLLKIMILRRGNVFWVHFGFNIGTEFGGKHPAIVLKSYGDSLIVTPLSTKNPKKPEEKYNVKIKASNLKENSWTNVLRLRMVSINRIDFDSKYGWIQGEKLNEISDKIKLSGVINDY